MKAVVFYESGDGLAEKAPLHAAAHRGWRDIWEGQPLAAAGRRRPIADARTRWATASIAGFFDPR